MIDIDKCSRCGKKIGSGFGSVTMEYHFTDSTNPPLKTLPNRMCDACIKSFFIWLRRGRII